MLQTLPFYGKIYNFRFLREFRKLKFTSSSLKGGGRLGEGGRGGGGGHKVLSKAYHTLIHHSNTHSLIFSLSLSLYIYIYINICFYTCLSHIYAQTIHFHCFLPFLIVSHYLFDWFTTQSKVICINNVKREISPTLSQLEHP